MKMFLGQFFQKARCFVACYYSYSPEETFGGITSLFSPWNSSSSFLANRMWEPRIKIKNTLNHSTVLLLFLSSLFCPEEGPHASWALVPPFPLQLSFSRFSILQLILIKGRSMSNESNSTGGNPYLINSYGRTPSRLNKNWLANTAKTNNTPSNAPSQASQPSSQAKQQQNYSKLMPKRVSQLSPSVIFQDADGRKSQRAPKEEEKEEKVQEKPQQSVQLGLIGNAFMGATTKYQKVSTEYSVSTPNKSSEDHSPTTIKKSETNSQASVNKFSRRRQVQPQVQSIELNTESVVGTTPKTDRSNVEGGRKIERKSERGKMLKFMDKKSNDVSDPHQEFGGQSKISEAELSKVTKETVSQMTEQAEQKEQTEQAQVQPQTRGYQPIQRNYQAPNRSRINNQTTSSINNNQQLPEQSVIKPETSEMKPVQQEPQPKQQITTVKEPETVASKKPVPLQRKPYLSRSKVETQPNQAEEKSSLNYSGVRNRIGSSGVEVKPQQIKSLSASLQQQAGKQSQVAEKVSLKRSNSVFYILSRLIIKKQFDSLSTLRQNSNNSKKRLNEANILSFSCNRIVNLKENNFLRLGFDQLKKKITAVCIQDTKNAGKQILPNPNNAASTIIEHFFRQRLRSGFNRLNNKAVVSQKFKILERLSQLMKAKESGLSREALMKIRRRGKQRWFILNSFSQIFISFMQQQIKHCFRKLLSFQKEGEILSQPLPAVNRTPKGSFVSKSRAVSVKQDSPEQSVNLALVEKEEKLRAISASLSDNLAILENDVAKVNEENSKVEGQYQAKLSVQRQHNQELKRELGAKRNFNNQLSKDIVALPIKVAESKVMEDELEVTNNRLLTLTNIYINHYRTPQEPLNIEDLISEFHIQIEDSNSLVNEWNLFLANHNLKLEIDNYEGIQLAESKARKSVGEEQEMALRLVRSYVREQYFWQWLHASVQNL